jgi:hypothetical protein
MVNPSRWLSLTPEPESELPRLIATLREGCAEPAAVRREEARIERLILRGSERRWLGYLQSVVDLVGRRADSSDREVADAVRRAREVVANHHGLLLGVSPNAGRRLTGVRERLLADLSTPSDHARGSA